MSEREIFIAALQTDDPVDRRAFLDEACAKQPKLRRAVEELLGVYEKAGSFLQHPAVDSAATGPFQEAAELTTLPESPGTLIGPYKLLEQIGEGGMGLVYMAEQQRPMRRLVALKLVKPGMDSKQVIARFEAERQALAMMDHPNIAKVHDAGTTETGRPYFAMELVRGIPINEFCDQQKLTVRQRLELFIQVCQAVQHAHQKGIIHRDLKPTNVLVTNADTVPLPKVIDFGIAKALGPALTDHTLHTGFAQLVGTPMYMSPEQAQMNHFGVDTRSDVYSLGVLLYELLTGTTPFDKETLSKAGLDEMRRMIREDDPPRPSARMSTLKAQALSTISQQRNIDPRRISANLRGELDWIVMKALEKDRSRRYESASALAADIQRYLSDEPVLACPPTAMYRFQKFARKHKASLTTAAAIVECLILGTTVSAWQAVRATQAEAQANANATLAQVSTQEAKEKAQEATTQRDEAQKQRDEVKALADRLQRTLYVAHMNLAQRALDEAAVRRLVGLLEQHRPKPGEPDLRGFEWYYLQRQHQGDQLLTLKDGASLWYENVMFSPDGKRLVTNTSSLAGTPLTEPELQVWDAQTGQKLFALKGDRSVVISPDGTRLAAATTVWDATKKDFVTTEAKMWDIRTGQEVFSLKGHTGDVTSVAFSPDGKRLASASGSKRNGNKPGEVKIWDAQTGKELLTFQGRTGDVRSVAFSPDGTRLAHGIAGGLQDGKRVPGTVKVWDVHTGKELLSLPGGGGSVAFSPDGKRLGGRTGGGRVGRTPVSEEARVWDAQTGKEISALQARSDGAIEFAFSPDGKRLAIAGQRWRMPSIMVCDTETGEELFILYGHTSSISSLAFSPNSKFLGSSSADRTVRLWDLQTGQQVQTLLGQSDYLDSVAYSPDGTRVASTALGNVKIWDALNASEAISLHGSHTAISPDFTRLASAEADKSVKIWDTSTRQQTTTLKGHTNPVLSLAFSPDGKRLASGEGGPVGGPGVRDPVVKVWDAQSGQELYTLTGHPRRVTSVAFSSDGKFLASRSQGTAPGQPSDVKVWDAQTGQALFSVQGSTQTPWDCLAFSSDGKRLASGSGVAKVWDTQTGQELLTFKAAGGGGIAFSSDDKRLATASQDDTVKIWDAQNGQELLAFKAGHTNRIMCLAFGPDGKRLVTAGGDGLVKIWDAQTGNEILSFKAHTAGVESVSFTPAGHRLASASTDGTVKIYDATPLPEKP